MKRKAKKNVGGYREGIRHRRERGWAQFGVAFVLTKQKKCKKLCVSTTGVGGKTRGRGYFFLLFFSFSFQVDSVHDVLEFVEPNFSLFFSLAPYLR